MDQFLYVVIVLVLHTKVDYAECQESIAGYTEITRDKGGQDVFRNPNRQCKSNFCANFNSKRVFAHCASPGCCLCRCNHGTPTYVAHRRACMKRADIYKLLPVNSLGYQYKVDIKKTRPHCHSTSLSLIDLSASGSLELYTCQSNSHTLPSDLASVVNVCRVLANDSWYYTETGWSPLLRPNESVFGAEVHLDKTANKKFIVFKWQNDTGHKYSGLIVFLRITCFNSSNVSRPRKSGFLFKTSGTKSTITSTKRPFYSSIYPATQTTHNPMTTGKIHSKGVWPRKTIHPITTSFELHTSARYTSIPTPSREIETTIGATGVNKGMEKETENANRKMGERDAAIVVAASASGLIFGMIAGTLITIILRKRGDNPDRGHVPRQDSEANPTYDRGPGKSIIFQFPEDGKPEDQNNTYQPLVQNTRIKEQAIYQGLNEAREALKEDSTKYQRKREQGKQDVGQPNLAYNEQGGVDGLLVPPNISSDDPVYHVLEDRNNVHSPWARQEEEPVYSYILEPWEQAREGKQMYTKNLQNSDTLQNEKVFETKEIEEEKEEKNYVEVAI